jgi:hypothetical protein
MAKRVGDLRVAGREPGDAHVESNYCAILQKRPRVPGGLAMRDARAARRRASFVRRMRTRVAPIHLILSSQIQRAAARDSQVGPVWMARPETARRHLLSNPLIAFQGLIGRIRNQLA